jgi:hypothetical protein
MNIQPHSYFIAPRYDRGPPTDPLELDLSADGAKLASHIRRELLRQKLGVGLRAAEEEEILKELEKIG